MGAEAYDITQNVNQLVDEYRTRCLWFLRPGYYPETPEQQLRVLSMIERTGDLAAFRRVSTLRQWLYDIPARHLPAHSGKQNCFGRELRGWGAALNEVMGTPRLSADVDLFHDTASALEASWQGDRELLERHDFSVRVVRERPSFVEAEVSSLGGTVLLQWVRDSAYRFFPLVEHADFGLTLHPIDLATNKVLALVGRLEVRDWVDVIECDARLQPLGYLAWAACSKDPGFSPTSILEHAVQNGRYSAEEVGSLAFDGPTPDAAELASRWHAISSEARATVRALPPEQVGKCVLDREGRLFRGHSSALLAAGAPGELMFHAGAIRGALPQLAIQ